MLRKIVGIELIARWNQINEDVIFNVLVILDLVYNTLVLFNVLVVLDFVCRDQMAPLTPKSIIM